MEKDSFSMLIGCSIVAGGLTLYFRYLNYIHVQHDVNAKPIKTSEGSNNFPLDIQNELESRVKTFFGNDGITKLKSSFVIVVGLGGVGSHAANMMVRSGIRKIRLIDFDQVTLSSLNRHAVATMADVGLSKAETMKKRLLDVVPWCQIDAVTEMFKLDAADSLLEGRPDFVIDCIDDVSTKAELIAYCKKNKIPVLTSMGAGGKSDPTRLRISALSDCINDPLAAKLKWKLKKHGVAGEDVMSVFSIEKPVADLLPLNEEQALTPQDYGNVDYMRVRVMPVLGTSPSIFGQAMASYILCSIAGKMYEPEICERISKNLKHKIRQVFKNNEMERFKTESFAINFDEEDMEFVVQQVWKSRCAVTSKRFGGHLIMTLTRWDPNRLPTPDNLVLMMQNEAELFAKNGSGTFSPDVVARIESRLRWAREVCRDSYSDEALKALVSDEKQFQQIGNSVVPIINSRDSYPSLLSTQFCFAGCAGGLCLGYLVGKYMKLN